MGFVGDVEGSTNVSVEDRARHFHRAMILGAQQLKKDVAYSPTRFIGLIAERGAVGAVKYLLNTSQPSDGFATLWLHGKLDMSVEAFVLLPWFSPLFEEHELAIARDRLSEREFDVDGFLRRAAQSAPSWTLSN